MEPEVTTMATILSNIGSVVTSAVSWMSGFVSAIADRPLLLLFMIIPLVGLGVGLLRRLINVN